MCKFSSKSGEGVPFQPLGDLTWNDPIGGYSEVSGGEASSRNLKCI